LSTPRLLVRVLVGLVLVCAGAVAVVGGLYLSGSGLVAVAVSGALVGCLAAGIARETEPGPSRTTPLEAAVWIGGLTVLALLVLSGTAVVTSGAVTAALCAVAVGVGVVAAVRRAKRSARPAAPPLAVLGTPELGDADHAGPVPGPSTTALSATALSTRALGREWIRTTALLDAALKPEDRAALVRRRQEALDELERRDPDGFGRWLTVGGAAADPADYVHGERTAGTDAA
jgi:hypothetical protein